MFDYNSAVGKAPTYGDAVAKAQQRRAGEQSIAINDQNLKQEQIQTEAAQQQQQDLKTAMETIAANGNDVEKALPQMAGKISPATYQKIVDGHLAQKEKMSKLKDEDFKREQDRVGQVGVVIDEASKLPPDQFQQAWPQIAARLKSVDPDIHVDPAQPVPMEALPMLQRGVQTQDAYLKREAEKRAIATQEETVRHNKAEEAKKPAAEQEFQDFYASYLGAKNLPKNAANEYKARIEFANRKRPVGEGGGGVGAALTPDAIDQAANLYLKTGQLPSFGMGKSATGIRTAILNRAAELGHGAETDIATNKATYKSDTDSLKGLQKQLDAVTAFESTASKNLDLFLNSAKNVVDKGSPWINKPLRALAGSVFGSADQAAYDAARQVALVEISRVVNNPNLSGVLSDSARREIAELNPESATLKQIYSVANILKQDMKNRHESLSQQVTDVKGRIHGGSSAPQKPAQPVTITLPSGKKVTIE